MKKAFKPGTTKVLSPRTGNFSQSWAKLVYSLSEIDNPSKEVKKKAEELWRLGYSYKDASKAISRMVAL